MTATEISNTVLRFFAAIDDRNWAAAQALMTDPFRLDYSSFGAGPPADLSPADILTGWQALLPGFDVTHHQLGALQVIEVGRTATVSANVTASHFIVDAEGKPVWTVFGSYEIDFVRADESSALASLTFNFKYQDGNTSLPSLAEQRVRSEAPERAALHCKKMRPEALYIRQPKGSRYRGWTQWPGRPRSAPALRPRDRSGRVCLSHGH